MTKFLNKLKEEQQGCELFEGREALKINDLLGKKLTLSNVDVVKNITDKFTGELKSVVVLGFEEYPSNFVYANAPISNFFLGVADGNFREMKEEIKNNPIDIEVEQLHNKKYNNDYFWLKIL